MSAEIEIVNRERKWDLRLLNLARHIADWSKDPSTKVGAVIADADYRIMGHGYNGFPRGVKDTQERLNDRAQKYPLVVHAELNAILNSSTHQLRGTTLYCWPLPVCPECAKAIAQMGIRRVVTVVPAEEILAAFRGPTAETLLKLQSAFATAHPATLVIFEEAGVVLTQYATSELEGPY